jgi:hypothetical protein
LSFHKSRVDTIRALLAGSPTVSHQHRFKAICDELEEVKDLIHITNLRRRHLLAVLHSSRALDDALKAFLAGMGLNPGSSLGNSLTRLRDTAPGVLAGTFTSQMRDKFQKSIVEVRNRYMHESGAYPNSDQAIRTLLSEIEHCISIVLALE